MVGPAGSGKATLAKSLAEALGLEFGFISLSTGATETHLLGRTLPDSDGAWRFKAGRFVELYESGGVFLLDEIDAADANVMVAINAALANGLLVATDGVTHKRHDRCHIQVFADSPATVDQRAGTRRVISSPSKIAALQAVFHVGILSRGCCCRGRDRRPAFRAAVFAGSQIVATLCAETTRPSSSTAAGHNRPRRRH